MCSSMRQLLIKERVSLFQAHTILAIRFAHTTSGKIRDSDFEQQRYRTKGLNLLYSVREASCRGSTFQIIV